jgi:hypothetical protein
MYIFSHGVITFALLPLAVQSILYCFPEWLLPIVVSGFDISARTNRFLRLFGLSDHSLEDFNNMQILIIEQDCLWSDFQRENPERFWIKELRALHPDGINRKQ